MKDVRTSYKRVATELARRLRKEIGSKLHSAVLYGSVARKEATSHSDIDVFLVIEAGDLYNMVSNISYDFDLENGVLTAVFCATPKEIERYVEHGSPFIENVAEEGEVLYDDGTFERIRNRLIRAGRTVVASR